MDQILKSLVLSLTFKYLFELNFVLSNEVKVLLDIIGLQNVQAKFNMLKKKQEHDPKKSPDIQNVHTDITNKIMPI